MGSFNKIGFHSGLPITSGTPIVLFICATNNKTASYESTPIEIDNLLSPICLPIYGNYNDYGRIESIIEDNNTLLLEKLYGNTLESLINMIDSYGTTPISLLNDFPTSDSDKDKIKKYISFLEKIKLQGESSLCLTMEHASVYYQMIDSFNKPMLLMDKWTKGANIGDYWLNKLGFIKDRTVDYNTLYRYEDKSIKYYISSRGYTPPHIMLDNVDVWSGYGGLTEFIDNFNRIANTKIVLKERYLQYSLVDASYDSCLASYFNGDIKRLNIVSQERIDELLIKFEGNESMTDYILNVLNHYNLFTNDYDVVPNDIIPLNKFSCNVNPNYMRVYNEVNIFDKGYKDIICKFIKFNNALRGMCGHYSFSSYCHQSIEEFSGEIREVYASYQKIIDNLTPIND